jgi:predicted HicB family RNase H-like nuclease
MYVTFSIRLPEEMHRWLKEKAEKDRRSMNQELIYLLEQLKEREKQDDLSEQ